MKEVLSVLILSIFFVSCDKQDVEFHDLISSITISPEVLVANGSDIAEVQIIFNEKSSSSLIDFECNISTGVFGGTANRQLVPEIEELPNGQIISKFRIQSSTANKPEIVLEINCNGFVETRTIALEESTPDSVSIVADAFSVPNDFEGELSLEAIIFNEEGSKVTQGTLVQIRDEHLDGGPVGGRFRNINLTTNEDSKVFAKYSPGLIDSNQFINLICDVLDDGGNEIGITDTLSVFVK